ncbi:MAG: hypothetical protein FWH38_09415 [Treponema sp.]|nr:hypothetical protein [Treponema sp.]
MQEISEYTGDNSEHELFSFFYTRIISREISTFSSLKQFAAPVLKDKRSHPVILRAFELIRRLYWGFFSSLTPQTHVKLWRELVIPDKDFPNAGDLKRTLQISNLYIAMLDIHGYTKFCMDSRKNLSMMHTLDRAIEYEIGRISAACGAISQRERGDEIVIVAASATDALTVTLSIIDYFSKTNVVSDPEIFTGRTGEAAGLPNFKISAGITGGNTTSPLIITGKGYLSGFLLNSGARLQTRANELSPRESRVMIARQVQMNFQKENAEPVCTLAKNNAVYFLDTGHIEFKGVMIPTCEAVFSDKDKYKEQFSEEMCRLFASIRDNLWEQRIFNDTVELVAKAAKVMPKFSITPPSPIEGIPVLTNDSMVHLGEKAVNAYFREEDYAHAVTILHEFIGIIEMIPVFDRLVLDYLKGVSEKYSILLDEYNKYIDEHVDINSPDIFEGNYLSAWNAAKKGVAMYEKLIKMGRKSPAIPKKKNLWYSLIKQNMSEMAFSLYSGKK